MFAHTLQVTSWVYFSMVVPILSLSHWCGGTYLLFAASKGRCGRTCLASCHTPSYVCVGERCRKHKGVHSCQWEAVYTSTVLSQKVILCLKLHLSIHSAMNGWLADLYKSLTYFFKCDFVYWTILQSLHSSVYRGLTVYSLGLPAILGFVGLTLFLFRNI